MKLAHLILAHNHPEQLERLINKLAHPDADVYVHIDAKVNLRPFENLRSIKNVYFITNRIKIYWGAFNMVEATVNSLKQIINSGNYNYINLLSGHDYPLQPANEFLEYLRINPGKAFMSSLVAETDCRDLLPRIEKYYLDNYRFPMRYRAQRLINRILPRRKMPGNMVLVGRSQWFTLSIECIDFILKYWDAHPAFRRFMTFTWGPDEFIFQTILYNSPLRDKMVNDDLRYIDWSAGGKNPKTLTMDDADKLLESKKFFARKFDVQRHPDVLDYIDKHLL
ncbi:beta-1,6-N-acetylglucosaminyltransferase [Mucilaginibacter roseus]|uniref:Peptide O-xylosyltransferase n=1 Tax=Mucilaginibacter roseus TaxID=1528868 RepID=A0ABS8U082_9SPHI|nr:beta-1,6-N-acetylglucosaminyltransferase [Mucilaginibacter roseus]MCD8739488.1 beta-1,6-N-acetylglucosaminyltransferase [Mucilaginibacter roseus]